MHRERRLSGRGLRLRRLRLRLLNVDNAHTSRVGTRVLNDAVRGDTRAVKQLDARPGLQPHDTKMMRLVSDQIDERSVQRARRDAKTRPAHPSIVAEV